MLPLRLPPSLLLTRCRPAHPQTRFPAAPAQAPGWTRRLAAARRTALEAGCGVETSLLLVCWAPVRSGWHTVAGWLRGVAVCKPGTTCSALPTRKVQTARHAHAPAALRDGFRLTSTAPTRAAAYCRTTHSVQLGAHTPTRSRRCGGSRGRRGSGERSECLQQQRQERTISSQVSAANVCMQQQAQDKLSTTAAPLTCTPSCSRPRATSSACRSSSR